MSMGPAPTSRNSLSVGLPFCRPANLAGGFYEMGNRQCSCGCGEPRRCSPSTFLSALSTTNLPFPQIFTGFYRNCSFVGPYSLDFWLVNSEEGLPRRPGDVSRSSLIAIKNRTIQRVD